MKGMNSTWQRGQHGSMLLVACVLSFAALLFAVDFSTPNDDVSQNQLKELASRRAENTPATPARQQSTPAPQPMRAILVEAVAAKIKAAYPHGGGTALPAAITGYFPAETRSAQAEQSFRPLTAKQRYFAFARAPPKSA